MAIKKELTNDQLEKEKLIQEIFFLSILVNTHTDFCVFVRYSGHVDTLEIDIATTKERYHDVLVRSSIDLEREPEIPDRLSESKGNLLRILETAELNVSQPNYDIVEVKKYRI